MHRQLVEPRTFDCDALGELVAQLSRDAPHLIVPLLCLVTSSPGIAAALKAYEPTDDQIWELRTRLGKAGRELLASAPVADFEMRWDCAAQAGLVPH